MKTKNLILTAVAVLSIAVAVSGCGVMSSNVQTSGAGQGIKSATITPGISEIGFITLYGNPTRIVKINRMTNRLFYKYVVLLYCLNKTARSHFLYGLINNKAVHNSCKAFYFLKNKLILAEESLSQRALKPLKLNDDFSATKTEYLGNGMYAHKTGADTVTITQGVNGQTDAGSSK